MEYNFVVEIFSLEEVKENVNQKSIFLKNDEKIHKFDISPVRKKNENSDVWKFTRNYDCLYFLNFLGIFVYFRNRKFVKLPKFGAISGLNYVLNYQKFELLSFLYY